MHTYPALWPKGLVERRDNLYGIDPPEKAQAFGTRAVNLRVR